MGPQEYEHFLQFFARHEPGLRAFVRSLLPAWDLVDDVIQDACLVMWKKFDQFEPGTDFLCWACTIARFEVLKCRRKHARDRHVFDEQLLDALADEGVQET